MASRNILSLLLVVCLIGTSAAISGSERIRHRFQLGVGTGGLQQTQHVENVEESEEESEDELMSQVDLDHGDIDPAEWSVRQYNHAQLFGVEVEIKPMRIPEDESWYQEHCGIGKDLLIAECGDWHLHLDAYTGDTSYLSIIELVSVPKRWGDFKKSLSFIKQVWKDTGGIGVAKGRNFLAKLDTMTHGCVFKGHKKGDTSTPLDLAYWQGVVNYQKQGSTIFFPPNLQVTTSFLPSDVPACIWRESVLVDAGIKSTDSLSSIANKLKTFTDSLCNVADAVSIPGYPLFKHRLPVLIQGSTEQMSDAHCTSAENPSMTATHSQTPGACSGDGVIHTFSDKPKPIICRGSRTSRSDAKYSFLMELRGSSCTGLEDRVAKFLIHPSGHDLPHEPTFSKA